MSKYEVTETTSGNIEDQIESVAGTVATDDSDPGATPSITLIGGEYRSSATTYSDGDATILQTDVNGYLRTAGTADYSATDDSDPGATPTIALVGGEYRASPTTYTDGDATVLQTDINGYLQTANSANYSATDDSAQSATPTIANVGGEYRATATTYTDGDAAILQMDANGYAKINIAEYDETPYERYQEIERFTATAGFTGTTADVAGIATTTDHVPHEDKTTSITFNKSGGTVTEGGIQKTISSTDASKFEGQTLVTMQFKVPNLTNLDNVFVRLGTDSSNYAQWTIDSENLTGGIFEHVVFETHQCVNTGTGVDFSDITYVAAGVTMDAAANTMSGIIIDYLNLLSQPYVAANLSLDVTSAVSGPQVRVQKFGNNSSGVVPVGNGAVTTGTQRITLASDSPVAAAEATDDSAQSATPTMLNVGGEYRSGATTYTDGDATILQTDVNGYLKCNIQSGGAEPSYTDTTIFDDSSDNGTPSGTNGTALQSNTKHAYVAVVAAGTVTNADINIYVRERGTDVWFIPAGATMDDLQDETSDRWSVRLANVGEWGTRVYCELDNYAGTGNVTAYMCESTT